VSRTLVVSAWTPEIAPLRRMLRADARRWLAAPVGVGAIDAGVGAARAIARFRPARVVFVGTAGVYPRRGAARIGSVLVAGDLVAVATAALRGEAYVPGPQLVRARGSARMSAALLRGLPPPRRYATVACPTAITRSATLARRIASKTGATLENLEAFAVARAARAAGLEFAAVLAVSNRVGALAHREWRVNHAAASRAACALLAGYLSPARK
jgi:nucleoside phosphorylase